MIESRGFERCVPTIVGPVVSEMGASVRSYSWSSDAWIRLALKCVALLVEDGAILVH